MSVEKISETKPVIPDKLPVPGPNDGTGNVLARDLPGLAELNKEKMMNNRIAGTVAGGAALASLLGGGYLALNAIRKSRERKKGLLNGNGELEKVSVGPLQELPKSPDILDSVLGYATKGVNTIAGRNPESGGYGPAMLAAGIGLPVAFLGGMAVRDFIRNRYRPETSGEKLERMKSEYNDLLMHRSEKGASLSRAKALIDGIEDGLKGVKTASFLEYLLPSLAVPAGLLSWNATLNSLRENDKDKAQAEAAKDAFNHWKIQNAAGSRAVVVRSPEEAKEWDELDTDTNVIPILADGPEEKVAALVREKLAHQVGMTPDELLEAWSALSETEKLGAFRTGWYPRREKTADLWEDLALQKELGEIKANPGSYTPAQILAVVRRIPAEYHSKFLKWAQREGILPAGAGIESVNEDAIAKWQASKTGAAPAGKPDPAAPADPIAAQRAAAAAAEKGDQEPQGVDPAKTMGVAGEPSPYGDSLGGFGDLLHAAKISPWQLVAAVISGGLGIASGHSGLGILGALGFLFLPQLLEKFFGMDPKSAKAVQKSVADKHQQQFNAAPPAPTMDIRGVTKPTGDTTANLDNPAFKGIPGRVGATPGGTPPAPQGPAQNPFTPGILWNGNKNTASGTRPLFPGTDRTNPLPTMGIRGVTAPTNDVNVNRPGVGSTLTGTASTQGRMVGPGANPGPKQGPKPGVSPLGLQTRRPGPVVHDPLNRPGALAPKPAQTQVPEVKLPQVQPPEIKPPVPPLVPGT